MARMTTPAAPAPPAGSRWQPATVTRLVSAAAWTMLFAQSAIIVTGALVRLTGSGLGCPTWPMCTDESLVNTPEMGIHGSRSDCSASRSSSSCGASAGPAPTSSG